MAKQSLEPIRLAFHVECDSEHAFRTWTARTSLWWPASHTVSGEPHLEFEPHVGGRIYERTQEGAEHDWGAVVAWEPPARIVYEWQLRVGRADATQVEIRFSDAPTGGTRVEIEHRGWERLGAPGAARREGNLAGWGSLLPHFRAAIGEGRPTSA